MTNGNCVFVVDEDLSARTGLARLLRSASLDVRSYATANEFLEALRDEIPACVVLDAGMTGLSGEVLQAEFEARSVRLPIIVVTADDDPETRRKAQKMKAVGFFRKPVDGVALLDSIKWALEKNLKNME